MTNQDLKNVLTVIQNSIDNLEDGQSLSFCKQLLVNNAYVISLVRDDDVTQLYNLIIKTTQKAVFGRLTVHLFYAVNSNIEK
jgi:hypothetical protein